MQSTQQHSTCLETFQFVHYFYGPIILCSAKTLMVVHFRLLLYTKHYINDNVFLKEYVDLINGNHCGRIIGFLMGIISAWLVLGTWGLHIGYDRGWVVKD